MRLAKIPKSLPNAVEARSLRLAAALIGDCSVVLDETVERMLKVTAILSERIHDDRRLRMLQALKRAGRF